MPRILLDSNIVSRYLDADNPKHAEVRHTLLTIAREGHSFCVVPQVVAELLNFKTRPAGENGFGLSPKSASKKIDALEGVFALLFPDARSEYAILRDLQRTLAVRGKKIHDLRLVAACLTLNIPTILTYDAAGYSQARRAGHVEIVTPTSPSPRREPK